MALLVLVAACRNPAPPIAPVEVVVGATDASAPAASLPTTASPREGTCSAVLLADKIETGASCFLDERISHGPGMLALPCDGADGPAEATFAEQRYEGRVKGGALALDLHTELDWDQDGCHWETRQSIRGALAGGKLTWTYSEVPTRGASCATPCKASAPMRLEP